MNKPQSFKELFEFYYKEFKPLYSHVQSLSFPPLEMFFEVNAAFDHLSRIWYYTEDESQVVALVCAHLKRGCFDAYKIIVREARDQYDQLSKLDTSVINNGNYDSEMRNLFSEIKVGSIEARQAEGDSRDEDQWYRAFDLWKPVYNNCVKFEKEYFLNGNVEWAKRKERWKIWRHRIEGVLVSLVAGLILWWVVEFQ